MKIFNGKKEANKILAEIGKNIEKKNASPKLAIISISPDKASRLYIRNKIRAGEKAGIKVVRHSFKSSAKESQIVSRIKKLNDDPSVNGIIVQLPLPKGFQASKLTGKISPKKDVDGFQKGSLFYPVLPSAICVSLGNKAKGKKVLALVNSKLFGNTLKKFLKEKGVAMDYLIARKADGNRLKRADVLITVCGCPGMIKSDMIKDRAILIDAGITMKGKKVFGDVDKESVAQKASFLTPVPGGIGPLTVALLLKNVYLSYGYSKNIEHDRSH